MRTMLKSKIHRACVTEANLDYEGSITIDSQLMQEADILPNEQVEVVNINNGARFNTYAIKGNAGEVCLNGAAARLGTKGDIIIILSYCHIDDDEARNFTPKIVHVDVQNTIIKKTGELAYK